MDNILSLINYFPLQIRDKILKYRDKFNMLEEIRIKANVNIILKIGQADIIQFIHINLKYVMAI